VPASSSVGTAVSSLPAFLIIFSDNLSIYISAHHFWVAERRFYVPHALLPPDGWLAREDRLFQWVRCIRYEFGPQTVDDYIWLPAPSTVGQVSSPHTQEDR
jgi:hypothetical protein